MSVKPELKAEQNKIVKLKTYDLTYFLGKNIFSDQGSQNMFVYQPTYNTLELREDKGID